MKTTFAKVGDIWKVRTAEEARAKLIWVIMSKKSVKENDALPLVDKVDREYPGVLGNKPLVNPEQFLTNGYTTWTYEDMIPLTEYFIESGANTREAYNYMIGVAAAVWLGPRFMRDVAGLFGTVAAGALIIKSMMGNNKK